MPATRWRIFLPPAQSSHVSNVARWRAAEGIKRTGMVVLELGQVVDIAIDNDVQVVGLVVRRNVACGEDLGHGGGYW